MGWARLQLLQQYQREDDKTLLIMTWDPSGPIPLYANLSHDGLGRVLHQVKRGHLNLCFSYHSIVLSSRNTTDKRSLSETLNCCCSGSQHLCTTTCMENTLNVTVSPFTYSYNTNEKPLLWR